MGSILIGVISGIVSGFGMGGGTLLIFFLTFFCGVEQHVAQACNLIFFIPTSIVAIYVNIKNKNADVKLALTISLFGIVGAIIGAKVAVKTDVTFLRKCFGLFLAIIACHEIYTLIKAYIKSSK